MGPMRQILYVGTPVLPQLRYWVCRSCIIILHFRKEITIVSFPIHFMMDVKAFTVYSRVPGLLPEMGPVHLGGSNSVNVLYDI